MWGFGVIVYFQYSFKSPWPDRAAWLGSQDGSLRSGSTPSGDFRVTQQLNQEVELWGIILFIRSNAAFQSNPRVSRVPRSGRRHWPKRAAERDVVVLLHSTGATEHVAGERRHRARLGPGSRRPTQTSTTRLFPSSHTSPLYQRAKGGIFLFHSYFLSHENVTIKNLCILPLL
jgi:hypothetical protein